MTDTLLSIVLPTYNGERYLAESVRSCIDQTYTNWELVIVDDASDDATPDIAQKLAAGDSRIRFIRHPENRGLPAALNTGFGEARGELLSWTSDDNLYRPHALEKMADFLSKRADIDVVYAGFCLINSEGSIIAKQKVRAADKLSYQSVVGPCFLFRRRIFESRGGYDENCFLVEDYEFWLGAMDRFTFAPMQDDLYLYRVNERSLSSKRRDEVRHATIRILKRHASAPNRRRPDRSLAHLRIARETAALGYRFAALGHLIKAVGLWPLSLGKPEILPAILYLPSGEKGYTILKSFLSGLRRAAFGSDPNRR